MKGGRWLGDEKRQECVEEFFEGRVRVLLECRGMVNRLELGV